MGAEVSNNSIRLAVAGALLAGAIGAGVYVAGRHQPAPQVTFQTLQQQSFSLTQWRGRVVLVNFWATSCPSCIREMPAMADTWRKYHHRGFELVAVAMEYDPPEYVMNYAQSNPLPFTVALDRQGDIARAFGGILGTPASFVIDKQGRIVQRYLGEPDFRQLHQLIEARLQES